MNGKALPLIVLLLLVPGAAAQATEIYGFTVDYDGPALVEATPGNPGIVQLRITDTSTDGVEGAPLPGNPATSHQIDIQVTPEQEIPGWTASATPPSFAIRSGQTRMANIVFDALPTAEEPFFPVKVNITLDPRASDTTKSQTFTFTGYNPGVPVFTVIPLPMDRLAPDQIARGEVRITNLDLQDKGFDMEVNNNPCGFGIALPSGNVVPARSTETFTFDIQVPADKFWYNYESCPIGLTVYPQGEPGQFQSVVYTTQVAGTYIDPSWVIWTAAIVLVLLILFLLAKRRKEAVEEEILGKPQKPWTIPAEKVYLEHLEERDPRAAYVVRHYLMEDEYQSALAWYYAYKKATKGERKKERLVVNVEHRLEKNRQKWEKRIAAPEKAADKYEARLQRKLQKKADKRYRKAVKAYDKRVEKIEAAHDKEAERAEKKWEKQAKRAEKKGESVPPRPDLGEPDLPEEPQREEVSLADHKWQAKADTYRAKMEKKQEALRAKAEKDQAKKVRKARKKARKIARELDDPDFIEEHPILSDSGTASS